MASGHVRAHQRAFNCIMGWWPGFFFKLNRKTTVSFEI
jgi:hypothetical protein